MNKYKILTLLFLLVSSGVESVADSRSARVSLTEQEQNQLNEEFIEAMEQRNINTVQELIRKGADIDATSTKNGSFGWTVLHWFIHDVDFVETLIKEGADVVKAQDNSGKTDAQKLLEIINGRRAADQRRAHQDNSGETPLMLAIEKEAYDTVRILVAYGADVNATDDSGNTVLHIVASKSYLFDAVPVLVAYGADFGARNHDNKTPLDLSFSLEMRTKMTEGAAQVQLNKKLIEAAAISGKLKTVTVKELLVKGANINARIEGKTALYQAAMHGNIETVKVLIQRGVDVHAKIEGKTTLQHVKTKRFVDEYTEIIQILEKEANKCRGAFIYG